jgi:hypothetical protein
MGDGAWSVQAPSAKSHIRVVPLGPFTNVARFDLITLEWRPQSIWTPRVTEYVMLCYVMFPWQFCRYENIGNQDW